MNRQYRLDTPPELTIRAISLGFVLSIVLGAANAYLGLFAGMTVSASIPAAVVSMGLFRILRRSSVLENNIVQTIASAGEALAAGAIFTLPALVLIGVWESFSYFEVLALVLTGGLLGVLFAVPLRRTLIVQEKLTFPEGIATAQILRSGSEGGRGLTVLTYGSLVGAMVKIATSGFRIFAEVFEFALNIGSRFPFYLGVNISPALLAVGYIVRFRIAVLVFLGGVLSWWIFLPILMLQSPAEGSLIEVAYAIWHTKIRYIGVGAMLIGGIWSVFHLRKSLTVAFREALGAIRRLRMPLDSKERTEFDMPLQFILLGIGVLTVPAAALYFYYLQDFVLSATMTIVLFAVGFLFSAVAGYMAGLVGSSNNPISGITIATVLTTAVLLLLLGGKNPQIGAAVAIMIGSVVCCAAAISGDTMQDLKSGYLLAATPIKQQVAQLIGVVAASLIIAPVLNLLLLGYGFGEPTPQSPNPLPAPQAVLMSSVATGVFGGNLPWTMVGIGIAIGILVILLDTYLEKKGRTFRLPVLAVAVGIYLPFELDAAIFLGGCLWWFVHRGGKKHKRNDHAGVLLASGIITGEALVGILLAIPIVVAGKTNVLQLASHPLPGFMSFLLLAIVSLWFVWMVRRQANA